MADYYLSILSADMHFADAQPGANVNGLVVRPAYRLLNALTTAVGTDTTGDKLTYTATKHALVYAATWFNRSGAPTVQLILKRGASQYILDASSANVNRSGGIVVLQPGDQLIWRVATAAAAGSTADATISVMEVA
jgi:hypothetical protein